MIKRIHHVSVVVRNLEEAVKLYEGLFGLRPEKIETLPEQGMRVALLPVGGSEIEFVQPLDPSSGVARFLESRGEGLHHICLEVDDVDRGLAELGRRGVRPV